MACILQQQGLLSTTMEREKIRAAVNAIPLMDGHAHNLVELDSSFSFVQAFTESRGAAVADVPHTLSFKSGVEHIAKLYNVPASLESIEEFRRNRDLETLTAKCFEAAKISTVLIDDGLFLDKKKDLGWHKKSFNDVHRILRIETFAEIILNMGPSGGGDKWTLNSFTDQCLAALKSQASSVVAFKSIAACRSGLNINLSVTERDAEDGLMQTLGSPSPVRLENKNIIDWIFTRSLELATSCDLPMQMHTGFGDNDLDLQLANPLLLRSVLKDPEFERARIVFLHASYPYMRQAAYLSSVYPQVHLDFGLAIPKLSKRGMKAAVAELLELAPINKVMFSTAACGFPESYYLGAKLARTVVADVLCDSVEDGDLTVNEAIEAAQNMLRSNSLSFYKLKGGDSGQKAEAVCQSFGKQEEPSWSCLNNVKFVRLMWADASGQRRCRVVPTERFKNSIFKEGVSLTKCVMAMSSHFDGPTPGSGLTITGELRLVPDLSTLIEVPQRLYATWLEEMLVNVEQFHPEGSGGQFEIVFAHEPVLKAADNREAITAAAISQNVHATFLPKLNLKNTPFGSGCHVHISLSKGGKNVFTADSETDSVYGMSETGASFLAGILEHLPAVLAFTAPHPNSYKRIQPRTCSGAYQCWGVENKEAPLRTCRHIDVITNVELKAFDGCANPHLGLAAVTAAGLDGLRRKLSLPPAVNVDPAELDKSQVKRLPTTASEAAQSLEDDETMRQLMGEKLVQTVLAIRREFSFDSTFLPDVTIRYSDPVTEVVKTEGTL